LAAQGADNETHDQQREEDQKQNFGDARRQASEAEETKVSGYDCKQEKYQRPAKQAGVSSKTNATRARAAMFRGGTELERSAGVVLLR
jgi:hypothetical protein